MASKISGIHSIRCCAQASLEVKCDKPDGNHIVDSVIVHIKYSRDPHLVPNIPGATGVPIRNMGPNIP